MLALNNRAGARGSSCATHAMIHSLSCASPLSLRESLPGAVAKGHVCRMASTRQMPTVTVQVERKLVMDEPDYGISGGNGLAPVGIRIGRTDRTLNLLRV